MRTLIYLVPFDKGVGLAELIKTDREFTNGQAVMDHVCPVKIETSEYHYVLDENIAEGLNTHKMVFIYSKTPMEKMMSLPVGRAKAHGPMVICGSLIGPSGMKYRGFSNEKRAIITIQMIVMSSTPDDQIDEQSKTLEEMLKEFGNRSET